MRLRFLLVTAALLSASLMARADSFTTFNLATTFVGSNGTIDGTLTFDTTTSMFTQGDIVASGFSNPADNGVLLDGPLTGPNDGQGDVGVNSSFQVDAETFQGLFALFLPTDTVVGFTGGSICTEFMAANCGNPTLYETGSGGIFEAGTGSLTEVPVAPPPAVTPEPTGIALLGTGLLGLAGVVRRRFV